MSIKIYTDGSHISGDGAWGYIIIDEDKDGKIKEIFRESKAERETTNNKMELIAAINGIEKTISMKNLDLKDITVYSDSMYLISGMNRWLKNWKKEGWKTKFGKPVKNKELWVKLNILNQENKIIWMWVKGHDGDKYNEDVDKMCKEKLRELLLALHEKD
jgi:ribonuclease HI